MSKSRNSAPAPAAPDEHAGHGGAYVVEADGTRRLVERTAPAEPRSAAVDDAAAAAAPQPDPEA